MVSESVPLTWSDARRRPRRLTLSGLLIAFVLSGVVLGMRQWRQAEIVSELIAEIEETGGSVELKPAVWERLAEWLEYGELDEYETDLSLFDPAFDDAWLEAHDNLRALQFRHLALEDTRLSDRGIAALLDDHDLVFLDLTDCQGFGRATANALKAHVNLEVLNLDGVRVSDDDLRVLPLEGLSFLSIERTPVTPAGLTELRRCERLELLWLDGEHLDDTLAETLRSLLTLRDVNVMGRNVTDEDVRLFRGMTQLESVTFAAGAVSPEALEELKRSIPGCVVEPDKTSYIPIDR
jgi:hypothetical protein